MAKLDPGPTRDTAVAAYAGHVMRSDPEGGIAWMESIENAELRDEALVAEGRSWMRRDPDAAGTWLESGGLSDSLVGRIRAE